jgi:hypothetical protein
MQLERLISQYSQLGNQCILLCFLTINVKNIYSCFFAEKVDLENCSIVKEYR